MKLKIQNLLISVAGSIVVIFLIYLGLTIVFYANSGMEKDNVFKEAWYTTATFFTGLCTLGTGVIATLLFNDWRDQVKENRKEYFILKYLDYIDSMRYLIFKLKFDEMDFRSQELFDAKIRQIIDFIIDIKPLEAGSRLKAIIKDPQLAVLIDKEVMDRQILITTYLENLKLASRKRKEEPDALINVIKSYSAEKSLTRVYTEVISKDVSEYCLKKLIEFDH